MRFRVYGLGTWVQGLGMSCMQGITWLGFGDGGLGFNEGLGIRG